MPLLRRLKAAVILALLCGLLSGLVGVVIQVGVILVRGGNPFQWHAISWSFRFFGALGLAFGAAFTLLLAVLGLIRPRDRLPAWLASLIGAVGAPVAVALLLGAANSIYLGPLILGVMAVLGAAIGGGIAATANRASLAAGTVGDALAASGTGAETVTPGTG